MHRKIGIVDSDNFFIRRFKDAITSKYEDVEIFIFPNIKSAQTAAYKFILHLLLVDFQTAKAANFTIPVQCGVVVLIDEPDNLEGYPLPAICKYRSIEEWYEVICRYCRCGDEAFDQGGKDDFSQNTCAPVCLFLSCGDDVDASTASSMFCHFLSANGFKKLAVFEPYFESGENVWRFVDALSEKFELVLLTLNEWNNENSIIPIINSKAVVLVTDGTKEANRRVAKYLEEIPKATYESRKIIENKTYILYNNFDLKKGHLIKNDTLVKIGGLGEEKNNQACFEKLVTILGV